MAHELLLHLILLFLGTASLVALCHRLGLSSIVGYLAAGLLFGPQGMDLLREAGALAALAEVGVVLLMFTIGLEFSLPRLMAARRLVLGLGGAQVALVTLVGASVFVAAGAEVALAVVLGGALAMSSTAIVLKQLGEQGELRTAHGRAATGILLFQDLAAVPFLVLLPLLGSTAGDPGVLLGWTLAKAALVFLALATLGRVLLPRVLHWVADTHSLELFMLAVLTLALVAAGTSMAAGLSATLGAFMAGMLLGETHFRHQVEADIRPFRDLMLGIFFISIGMQLEPAVLLESPLAVLAVVAGVTVLKGLLVFGLIRAFGHARSESLRGAIVLAHGGEFGLLLVSQAMQIVDDGFPMQPVLAGLIVSMLIAPLLIRFNRVLARGRSRAAPTPENLPEQTEGLEGHVVICGYGPLGQGVAGVLRDAGVPVLAIDRDAGLVRACRSEGHEVLFGDAGNAVLLDLARVREARALAITFHEPEAARRIIAQALRLRPDLPILVHTRHGWHDSEERLPDSVSIFDSVLESSLMYARALLLLAGLDDRRSEQAVDAVRASDYSVLREAE